MGENERDCKHGHQRGKCNSCDLDEAIEQAKLMRADIEFLLRRAMRAGKCSFASDREEGISSNSIVGIVYGVVRPEDQEFPADSSDMMACRRMWERLPEHRKTEAGWHAMALASNAIARAT